jgi:hypothetical protein
VSKVWPEAEKLRDATLPWLPTAKVELDRDPSNNIGGLHGKAAEIRSQANKVRDVVFGAMAFNMALRRESAAATWAYEQAKTDALKVQANIDALAKLKTKDEREAALQQIVATEYKASIDAHSRLEEWDQFLKMVNLVYYSLTHTREDLNTQVSIIKQQMFNGEIKADKHLEKLGSVFDMLGEGARSLLQVPSTNGHHEDVPPIPGGSGETDWGVPPGR